MAVTEIFGGRLRKRVTGTAADTRWTRQLWAVFCFCGLALYLVYFYQLGTLPFVGADEPRYARIGQEMWQSADVVTPTLEGDPWLEKPPLLFWMEAVSYQLFGVSESTARLPVATLGLLTALCLAWMGHRIGGGELAILSLLILSTSALFFTFSRFASTDLPLVAFFSMAMMLAYLASENGSTAMAAVAGGLLGLAVLAKGPVALILFGGVLAAESLLRQRLFWSPRQIAVAAGSFGLISLPWFWLVWQANGFNFVAIFWVNHHFARFLTEMHRHSQPFWYYLPVLFLGFFPWSPFLGSNLVRLRQSGGRLLTAAYRLDLFLWLWVLVPLLFFSISSSKLAGYILPVFPALAFLVALEWNRYLKGDLTAFRCMWAQLSILFGLTVVLAIGLILGGPLQYRNAWIGVVLAAPLLLGAAWARLEWRRRRPRLLFVALSSSMVLFAALAFGVVSRVVGNFHSAKSVALAAGPLISPDRPLIQFRYFHHTASYYTEYQATSQGVPTMLDLFEYMLEHDQERYYIVTKDGGLKILNREVGVTILLSEGNLYLVEIAPD